MSETRAHGGDSERIQGYETASDDACTLSIYTAWPSNTHRRTLIEASIWSTLDIGSAI